MCTQNEFPIVEGGVKAPLWVWVGPQLGMPQENVDSF